MHVSVLASLLIRHTRNASRFAPSLFLGAAFTCAIADFPSLCRSEEPYAPFLQKLRDEKLYDLALVYVGELEAKKVLEPEPTKELVLERAILLRESAAVLSAGSAQRSARLDEAKQVFDKFIAENKNHPRRGEARMGLGNLLLSRAEEAASKGEANAAKPEAIRFYGDAEKLFADTQKELEGILTEMKGARTDSKDEGKVALRDKLRDDYRHAQLLHAYAIEHRGRSQAKDSKEWKADLEKAQGLYADLIKVEKERIEARCYAIYYRSGIYRDLGKNDDAVNGYQSILAENVDPLRPLQFKALTELVNILGAGAQLPAAIDLASKWERQIRPDERASQDVIDFQLASIRNQIALAEQLAKKDADDKNIAKIRKDARETLQKLVRISGPHQTAARELMVKLGISKEKAAAPVELPKVKNFEEALKEAVARLEQADEEGAAQEKLLQEIDKSTDEDQRKQFSDQLNTVNANLDRLYGQSSELLRTALRMFPPGGEAAQLAEVRYRLAYAELQKSNAWDAVAIGEFLASTNAGNETGLQCAKIALAGYGKLITEADPALQKTLTEPMQPFAEFMVRTWPDATESQAAASALTQLSMNAGDFESAKKYLDKLPTGGGRAARLRRDVGLVIADQYFQEKAKLADGATPSAELISKRDTAIAQLTSSVDGIKKDEVDSRFIQAINSLVRLNLASGKVDEAVKWINNKTLSPVELIRENPDLVEDKIVKLDTYRSALQATVSQLQTGSGNSDALKQVSKLIDELKVAAGTDKEGKEMLTSIFVKVARDLQDLVEGADSPAKKQKLAEGMVLVCQQIADSSDDFSTKMWAAQTLTNVGNALDKSAKETRESIQGQSVKIMEGILAKEASSPGFIKSAGGNGELFVRVTMAKSLKQAGKHQEAIDQITKALSQNAAMLDLQIEAAEIYQAWGESGDASKFDLAIVGGPQGANPRVIWGWGKLSSALSGKKNLKDQYFHCRYHLIQCFFEAGKAENDPKKKTQLFERAVREIGSTKLLNPDLGGPESQAKFEQLEKTIRAAM